MPAVRVYRARVMAALLLAAPVVAADRPDSAALPLSLEQFTQLALEKSLRSQNNENGYASSRWSWMASRRALTWPTLTASGTESKSFSDTDTGIETRTKTDRAALSLSQPLLTGTRLSLSETWTHSPTEVNTLGVRTRTPLDTKPALSAGVSQPIFLFTQNSSLRSRRQANLSWENAQQRYRQERIQIETDARSLYYRLFLQSEQMKVEQKKFESARLVNDATRALVRAGKLAELESVRAEIRSKTDERRIQNARNNLEKTMNQAKDLILLPADKEIRLTSTLSYERFVIPLEKLVQTAVESNPSLLNAHRGVELAEIALHRTKEGDRPSLTAEGTYALTANRSNPDAPLDPSSWTAALNMSWPLFDASQTRLSVKNAQLALADAKRSYETTFRDLKVSIENALLELKRIEDQLSDFDTQTGAAEKNLQAIRLQYRNGLTRLTDVFDAEIQLRDLQLEYLQLLVDFNTSRDSLKKLVGTDLSKIKGASR